MMEDNKPNLVQMCMSGFKKSDVPLENHDLYIKDNDRILYDPLEDRVCLIYSVKPKIYD